MKPESSQAIAPVWQWSHLPALSVAQCEQLFALRQQVFIVEQNCPYLDIDGKDQEAIHLLGWHEDKLLATLRLFTRYSGYDGAASLGRVCTHPQFRRFGLGRQMMNEAIRWLDENLPQKDVVISAQQYLEQFYRSFGFVTESEPYLEDDIPHIRMRLRGASQN